VRNYIPRTPSRIRSRRKAAALIFGAFIIALATILLFYLIRAGERSAKVTAGTGAPRQVAALQQEFLEKAPVTAHQDNTMENRSISASTRTTRCIRLCSFRGSARESPENCVFQDTGVDLVSGGITPSRGRHSFSLATPRRGKRLLNERNSATLALRLTQIPPQGSRGSLAESRS